MLAMLLAGYMRLVRATTRWEVRGLEHIIPVWETGEGVIGALWHGRVLMSMAAWPMDKQPPAFLISRSADGAFIARATAMLGAGVIRGSAKNMRKDKDKGGSAAASRMIKHVKDGGCMALTPDGPRGPLMHAGMGTVRLARLTGAPMIGLSWSTRWRKVFSSWDRFILPLPFGRGVIVWTGIITVPGNADDEILEEKRQQLQSLLREATKEADIACGHNSIEASP